MQIQALAKIKDKISLQPFVLMQAWIKNNISAGSFLKGLLGVLIIYAALFAYVLLQEEHTIKKLEEKLASRTVLIKRSKTVDFIPEAPDHSENNEESHGDADINSHGGSALKAAPFEGLFTKTDTGLLPKTSAKGLSPFNAYKRPFIFKGDPVIALAVIDYGLSDQDSKNALFNLPPEVTFILSPYSVRPDFWQSKARKTGHEIWIYLPLQNERYPEDDPGSQVLLSHASLKYNQDKLDWALSRTSGYAGIATEADNNFMKSQSMLQSIIKSIFGHGIGYFEINPDGPIFIETIATANDNPYIRNNYISGATHLKDLEELALKNGYAVALMKPDPGDVNAISEWAKTLEGKGISLAPISFISEANHLK